MQYWYKYRLDPLRRGTVNESIDRTFEEHARSLDGFEACEAYKSRESFFRKYYYGHQNGRLEEYDRFLRKRLRKNQDILSVGGGRCANELFLMEDGYRLTCSDLLRTDTHGMTQTIFPEFQFLELDILKDPPPRRFDAIVSLSLIYLFDRTGLRTFFRNISEGLRPGGHFILDSAGSPDNVMSTCIHDILLPAETFVKRWMKWVLTLNCDGLIRKHHGYRRTDLEITDAAGGCGLNLVDRANYAFTTEFGRSPFLTRVMGIHPRVGQLFEIVGQHVPYIRMFDFEKVNHAQTAA